MPDITMCSGQDCPLKEKCYRYKATPSKYQQSYFSDPPCNGDKCDYFMPIDRKIDREQSTEQL